VSFYLRKSIKAGPFRFNLSKSGLGVSAGVPGFRIGSGPRGNYVRVAGGIVEYRSTQRAPVKESAWTPPPPPPVADVLLEDVTGAPAAQLLPTGSGDIVGQLNEAAERWRVFPYAVALLVLILLAKPIVGVVLFIPAIPALVWLWFQDQSRRTVVAFYDVNDETARWFGELVDAMQGLAGNQGLWRVNAAGNVQTTYQYKVNAGSTTIVSRATVTASLQPPAILATNIAVPSVTAGKAGLFFLPDRLLVRDGKRFSDVSYDRMDAGAIAIRFTESDRVPRDAQQVDTTWRYVNVKGGPDRRFKTNRQLPVMLYGEIGVTSPDGLHWLIQCSQPHSGERLIEVLETAPRTIETGVTESSLVDDY
jgi:hypothetical protein